MKTFQECVNEIKENLNEQANQGKLVEKFDYGIGGKIYNFEIKERNDVYYVYFKDTRDWAVSFKKQDLISSGKKEIDKIVREIGVRNFENTINDHYKELKK